MSKVPPDELKLKALAALKAVHDLIGQVLKEIDRKPATKPTRRRRRRPVAARKK